MEWLWPVLATSALGIMFSFVVLVLRVASDVRDIKTRFESWAERCDLKHKPLDTSMDDQRGRINNHAERLRVIEARYGIRGGTE